MKVPLKTKSIRTKMFVLVTLILLSTIFAVLWKTRQIFFEDKYDFIRQLSSKISSSSSRLADQKLLGLQNQLALFVSTKESLQKVKSGKDLSSVLFERFDDFLSVSIQKQLASKEWVTQWTQVRKGGDFQLDDSLLETVLRSIDYDTLGTGQIRLSRFEDMTGHPFFAMYFLADIHAEGESKKQLSSIVGFLSPDFLRDVIMDYKGDLSSVFLVDNKGYIYAHPHEELIGQSIAEHPVIQEIIQGRETGSGLYSTKDREDIIGNYNLIPGTNLYMVVTTPQKQAFAAARDLLITVLTFGFGFLVIGSVLTYMLASKITKPLQELKDIAVQIGGGDFRADVNVKANDEVGDLANSIDVMRKSLLERDEKIEQSKAALVQSEKLSAFGQLSAGIAHEVKNPLAGILGHAQLAKSKSKEADVTKHLDMIEKETRRTKEIIENLMRFARAEKPDLTPTDLCETVNRAVDLVDHQLSLMGVKIIRDIQPVQTVSANSNQIQQVLLNFMMNAGHAMEKSQVKELKVSVADMGDWVRITLKDTGHGMSPEVQKRIFEPFFTTKPAGKGTGLGLSVSFGIIRDHKGKISLESKVNEGTSFFIDLPRAGSAVAAAAATADAATTSVTSAVEQKKEGTKSENISDDLKKEPTLSSGFEDSLKKISETSTNLKFPEFSGKTETTIDSQVQRDYLKSHHEGISKSIHDVKKEASRRLNEEKDVIKPKQEVETGYKEETKNIEKRIESIKKEIASTEVEIKSFIHENVKNESKSEQHGADGSGFKVNIRKPKLKA